MNYKIILMESGEEISKNWLENFKRLDNKNHLKHGEFYANDGSVHDLEIDNNIVTAKVDGKIACKAEISFMIG